MTQHDEFRACRRIPFAKQLQVISRGKAASYAMALNISLGGLLLSAAPSLPVGSSCKLAIPPEGDGRGERLLLEGTVIRSDAKGVAVRFDRQLEETWLRAIAPIPGMPFQTSIATAYLNYFKVSQKPDFAGSERLMGVSPAVFKKVILTTFMACIPLAVLPIWLFKDNFWMMSNWLKVLLSFAYATLWFAVIQPFLDLFVFKVINKHSI